MICKKCGAQLEPGAAFCTNCGEMVTEETINSETIVIENGDFNYNNIEEQKNGGFVCGLLGLIFGAISFVSLLGMCCYGIGNAVSFPFSIAGLILSIIGKKQSKKTGHSNVMATLGLVFSIIALIVTALVLIAVIIYIVVIVVIYGATLATAFSAPYYYY